MASGNNVHHTFAIDNNVRRFPEDIDSVDDILAGRANGESDIERHKEERCTGWC